MIDKGQIYKWWDLFKGDGTLTEIRVLDGKKTYSGYFNDIETLIKAVEPFDKYQNAQIYYTLNCIKKECFGRSQSGQMLLINREPTTGDSDIAGRTHVLIDLDPKRPAGVSSSNEELEYAHYKAIEVYKFLLSQGFYEPIIGISGNGYHIYIPCEIAATEERTSVIKKFLQVLSLLFSDDKVEVDEKVYNLSRISKLPGTTARKGKNISERPWRQSRIVKYPLEVKPTDIAYFKKIAAMYPEDQDKPSRWNGYSPEKFNLIDFLNKHGIIYKEERVSDGVKYILDHCPFNEQHKHKDAVIFQRNNGAIGFLCFHNSCSEKTWRDVRLLFEPDAYDKDYIPQPQLYKQSGKFTPLPPSQPLKQIDEKGKIWLKMSEIKKPKIDLCDYIPSGIPFIDSKGLGFRRGHVSIWTGFRGCGKSSLLNMLILNAAQKCYKSALWTGELTGDMIKQWLYLQAAGKQFNKKYSTTDYYFTPDDIAEKIDPWIDKYLWLFNNKYGDNFMQIADQVRRLKEEERLDCLFLDNLMVLNFRELDQDKYERQGVLLQRLEDLAKELDIHIHLVAHPNKANGYLRIDNISGSGDISNKADNVFILSRINTDFINNACNVISKPKFSAIIDSKCTNVIEIAKFRNKGSLVDHFINLWFELESNRLKTSIAENICYAWRDDIGQEQNIFSEGDITPIESQPTENDRPFGDTLPESELPF